MAKISRLLSLFIVMLLLASHGPTAANSSVRTEPIPDEVDDLARSTKTAIEIINQNLKVKNRELLSVIEQMQALIDAGKVEDVQDLQRAQQAISELKEQLAKVELKVAAVLEEARSFSAEERSGDLKRLKEQNESLRKLLLTKTRAFAGMETAAARAVDAAIQAAEAARAQPVLIAISQDRLKTAKLIEGVRNNNRVGLSEMLKRESPGSDVDVREVKDTNGLLVLFRVGDLTHCLSTKQQCGGKPYSVTR